MSFPHEAAIEKAIDDYKSTIADIPSEHGKTTRFTSLLNELFNRDGLNPQFLTDWVKSFETPLRLVKEGIILRRADALYGNVLFEFERNLGTTHLREAERQLLEYLQAAKDKEDREFVGIASDGETFRAYSIYFENGKSELALIEEIRVDAMTPMDFYYWLDRYLLRTVPLSPTSERFLSDFGPRTHALSTLGQLLQAAYIKHREDERVKVLFGQWDKYLRVAYGSSVAAADLFVRHTYLATLAKLLAWLCVEHPADPMRAPVQEILEGSYFRDQNIFNFLEEDFFSWLAIPLPDLNRTMMQVANGFLSLLKRYNLHGLSEDVLKGLYQGLVDPKDRHDLGEYYTPDWLAELITRHTLGDKPQQRVLDPTCGSGTFLYTAIRIKKENMPASKKALMDILNSTFGFDIHPLAVIIAKTNYLLGLGDLLQKREDKRIDLPIYLANSILLTKEVILRLEFEGVDCYRIEIGNRRDLGIPQRFIDEPKSQFLFDVAIDTANEYAQERKDKGPDRDFFSRLLTKAGPKITKEEHAPLFQLADAMRDLAEKDRDTIWAFVIKNTNRPVMVQGTFDLLLGNPPWLTLKDLTEKSYQDEIKKFVTRYDLEGRGHLMTHLELAAVYWVRASTKYLKPGKGGIAFVMPRSVFNAAHHDKLRQGLIANAGVRVREIWDMNASTGEAVSNLFHVPSCVLFGDYDSVGLVKALQKFPIPTVVVSGRLREHNARLLRETKEEIETSSGALKKRSTETFLTKTASSSAWSETQSTAKVGKSAYFEDFYEGATLVPRSLWFVEPDISGLGVNTKKPKVHTDPRARKEAKKPYDSIALSGSVESEYLFGTLLSTDLIPFGHLPIRTVIIPAKLRGNKLEMIDEKQARNDTDKGLAEWLNEAEQLWNKLKTAKNELSVYARLNYNRGITQQNIRAKYRVLYPKSASKLCASVVHPGDLTMAVGEQPVALKGLIVDHVCYYFQTNDRDEAHYLTAILNSDTLQSLVEPVMTRGFTGAGRDFHKKPLEFPIPKFDPSNANHLRLVDLAKSAEKISADFLESNPPPNPITPHLIGNYRNKVRDAIRDKLSEIDEIVSKLLKS